MKSSNVETSLHSAKALSLFEEMYGKERVHENVDRYLKVASGFVSAFGDKEFYFFSSPGRTEIGGNHTDHNHGKVLAASIHMDCVAAAAPNRSHYVNLISENYHQNIRINLHHLEPGRSSFGSVPLIKGILYALRRSGYVRGFDAYLTSNVIGGVGVSSSASFEMLICTIVDYLFNKHSLGYLTYAKAGQFAENKYWHKSSGLLDQLSCSVGGIVSIDFSNIHSPEIHKLNCNFKDFDMDLILVNTGKSHSCLSAEYSSIPYEMRAVSRYLGKRFLSEITKADVLEHAAEIRKKVGDRAFLRALHFFEENERVEKEITALEEKDAASFLDLIKESGNSSWKWLQNCYLSSNIKEQHISCALAVTELFLSEHQPGACRVHGGGFAGVIAVYLPHQYSSAYCEYMHAILGKDCTHIMHIRKQGAIRVEI